MPDGSTSKLDQLINKFKAFRDRMRNEIDMLQGDLSKYLNLAEYEASQAASYNDVKLMDLNFFKQQFTLIVKPCSLILDKLQSQFKLLMERQL